MKEEKAYILGTDKAELHRLGIQHQVWAKEAQKGWNTATFSTENTILDLGCGPGFCSKELGYIVGEKGKVIAIDKSQVYLDYLNQISKFHGLNIETVCTDFSQLDLSNYKLDGMYCRWALAWYRNPKEVLLKVKQALKPNGKMVIHEYYDWSTHQTEPSLPNLSKAINGSLQSFKDQEGEIDIGRYLPNILTEIGMKVTSIRPMSLIASPKDLAWQWPKSFYEVYFPKLAEMNIISIETAQKALEEMDELSQNPNATLFCPMMVEVIAEKI